MNKYRNKKIVIDGIKFDSIKEGNKYLELKVDPSVKEFKLQPKFLIVPSTNKDGQKYRARYYKADFDVYYVDGTREIIDVKPFDKKKQKYYLTAVFQLKARLFDHLYPDLTLVIE